MIQIVKMMNRVDGKQSRNQEHKKIAEEFSKQNKVEMNLQAIKNRTKINEKNQ